MQKAAAYIRVSDERQDEFSPDSQLKLIREFCTQNDFELSDDHIFYDDGISAKNAERRKEFCRMIEAAKSPIHPFDVVIVWKYSRFARNQEESIIYKSLLRKHMVKVISVSEPMSDDPFSSLVERIIEWMDEYYVVLNPAFRKHATLFHCARLMSQGRICWLFLFHFFPPLFCCSPSMYCFHYYYESWQHTTTKNVSFSPNLFYTF